MINKVTLIGHLGQDPEIRRLENGTPVGRFSVATTESYKDANGEWQNVTEWHAIIVWRDLAERAEKNLKKGSLVFVEGKITYRKYTDKNGIEKTATEIVASTVRSLEKREKVEPQAAHATTPHENDVFSEPKTVLLGVYEKMKGEANTITVISIFAETVSFTSSKKGDAVQKMPLSEFAANVLPLYKFIPVPVDNKQNNDDLPF